MTRADGRYIPQGAQAVENTEANAVVYTYEARGGLYAIAYSGKRRRDDFHYRYGTEERRAQAIENFFADKLTTLKFRAERKAVAKAESAALLAQLKPGTILYTSWGYDQTNVDWYQVITVKGCTVTLRPIAGSTTENGYMSGKTVPVHDEFTGNAFKKVIRSGSINIESYASAWVWDGTPKQVSWYA